MQSIYDFHNDGVDRLGSCLKYLKIENDDNCAIKIAKLATIIFTALANLIGRLFDYCFGKTETTTPVATPRNAQPNSPSSGIAPVAIPSEASPAASEGSAPIVTEASTLPESGVKTASLTIFVATLTLSPKAATPKADADCSAEKSVSEAIAEQVESPKELKPLEQEVPEPEGSTILEEIEEEALGTEAECSSEKPVGDATAEQAKSPEEVTPLEPETTETSKGTDTQNAASIEEEIPVLPANPKQTATKLLDELIEAVEGADIVGPKPMSPTSVKPELTIEDAATQPSKEVLSDIEGDASEIDSGAAANTGNPEAALKELEEEQAAVVQAVLEEVCTPESATAVVTTERVITETTREEVPVTENKSAADGSATATVNTEVNTVVEPAKIPSEEAMRKERRTAGRIPAPGAGRGNRGGTPVIFGRGRG